MRIAVAQLQSTKGDITKNIEKHKTIILEAAAKRVELIVFPELSLTGYEPELARELALDLEDDRLTVFQRISNKHQITIGLGAPTKNERGICISMLLFQPNIPRQIYSKKYLHADEEPYFVSGETEPILRVNQTKIALAICYEVFVLAHAENACANGATIYLTSVAKSKKGIEKAYERLPEIAQKYEISVLMANCIGPCDNFVGDGQTAIWTQEGNLIEQMGDKEEGFLILDHV